MKKLFKVVAFISLAVAVVGCTKKSGVTDNTATTETTPISTDDVQDENLTDIDVSESTTIEKETTTEYISEHKKGYGRNSFRTYADEDMKRLGVEKKLVILCNWLTAALPESVTSRFNELLVDKYGCDFVVEFIGFDFATASEDESEYSKALYEIKEMGQQADVILAGSGKAMYSSLIDEGLLCELTDILTDTEDGKLLFEVLAEKSWKCVERNGEIYGIPWARFYQMQNVLVCNKKLAESLGIEVPEGFLFDDIGKLLAPVAQTLNEQKIIGCFYSHFGLIEMLGYYELIDSYDKSHGVFARQNDVGEWVAFNPLEDEAFVKMCKLIREYKESWMFLSGSNGDREIADIIDKGEFVFYIDTIIDMEHIEGDKIYTEDLGIAEVIVGNLNNGYLRQQEINVKGIASWSQYKEEAVKLLRILHTEEEICNLLVYGIEDEHYIYADREVFSRVTNVYKDAMRLSNAHVLNTYLTHPVYLEPDNKVEYYRDIINDMQEDPFLKYSITFAEYESVTDKYSELAAIYKQYYIGLISGRYEDVDAVIAEAVKLQKEAGIDNLMGELNAMFEGGAKENE